MGWMGHPRDFCLWNLCTCVLLLRMNNVSDQIKCDCSLEAMQVNWNMIPKLSVVYARHPHLRYILLLGGVMVVFSNKKKKTVDNFIAFIWYPWKYLSFYQDIINRKYFNCPQASLQVRLSGWQAFELSTKFWFCKFCFLYSFVYLQTSFTRFQMIYKLTMFPKHILHC